MGATKWILAGAMAMRGYGREQHQRERESVHRCGPRQQTGRWNRSGRLSWQPAPYWKLLKIPTAPFAGRARHAATGAGRGWKVKTK